jgi:hypothetical protein
MTEIRAKAQPSFPFAGQILDKATESRPSHGCWSPRLGCTSIATPAKFGATTCAKP